MFDTSLHRRIAVAVALVALTLAGASAGAAADAPATASVSITETQLPPADAEPSVAVNRTSLRQNLSATVVTDGERLTLRPTRNQNVTIRTNADVGTTLYVVLRQNGNYVDMYDVTVSGDGTATASLDLRGAEPGTNLTVTVRHDDVKLANATGVVSSFPVSFVHEGDRLVLRNGENQTVGVRTDAAPGTELIIEARASGEFLKTQQVVVGDDGTASATFDFSDVVAGTPFTASVRRDDDSEVNGLIVNASATVHRNGTFTVSDSPSAYTVRGVADTRLPDTKLNVRLTAPESSLSANRTVTVDENGTFEATFDLSSLPATATVSVKADGIARSAETVAVTDDAGQLTLYTFVEPPTVAIRHAGERLLVHPNSTRTIRGTTNLAPGTNLTVSVEDRTMNVENPFSATERATVDENGRFAATFDFDGTEPGTNLSLSVSKRGTPLGINMEEPVGVVNESADIQTVTTTTSGPEADAPIPGFGAPTALAALLAALALVAFRRD